MAEGDTLYNPGKSTFRDVVWKKVDKRFPELKNSGHYDFNKFLAKHPELQGMTEHYNVIGGMNVADVIPSGSTKWSGDKGLSTMGGLYTLVDSITNKNQSLKEGLADWLRNTKGIGIQRDWNPLGLLYTEDEADYYKEYYKKLQKDYEKKMKKKIKKAKGGLAKILEV